MSCSGCAALAERVDALEQQNTELAKELNSLKSKLDLELPSPIIPAQEFPALSPPSPAMGMGTPALAVSPSSPRSPGLGPTLLSKVSSRVHRILAKPDQQPHGPVTVRRNSNTVRPRGFSESNTEGDSIVPVIEEAPPAPAPIVIPEELRTGITFMRVTHNKRVNRVLKLDENTGILSWHTKPSSRLSLDRICDIYVKDEARNYREMFKISKDLENRWATIIHQRPGEQKVRALHLVVSTSRDFDILMSSITQLLNFRREMMSGLTRAGSHFVEVHWSRAAHNERISFDEFLNLARQLHINTSRHFLLKVFTEADIDASGSLDFEEFKHTVQILSRRQDILDIYALMVRAAGSDAEPGSTASSAQGRLSRDTFFRFMTQVQKYPAEKIDRVWSKYQENEEITPQSFCSMLTSTQIFPAVVAQNENLDAPITEYWISSSHNTYLTGKQVGYGNNNTSVEGYIRSLQSGCRCVEIDIWDGSNGPIVCHGSPVAMLTNSLGFNEVVQAIRKYGFLTSPYPLILSLEVHCNHDNQLRVAAALRNILGEMLVTRSISTPGFELPSPNELKHRVLIKVKASGALESFSAESSADEAESTGDSTATARRRSSSSVGSSSSISGKSSKTKIISELGDLGVYLSARKYRNFTLPEAKAVNHCFSFSESTAKTLLKNPVAQAQLVKHNTKYFARVYPSALKIFSKNFNPMMYWRLGFQMVALNWQTFDLGMQLNSAFHSPHCGYVRKPAWMRPSIQVMAPSSRAYRFSITVISAQQLPRPVDLKSDAPLNPCVAVERYGPGEEQCLKSPVILDNGFNPVWNFPAEFEITEGDLDFVCLRFAVYNNEEDMFAANTVKLRNLCSGYRHLPLQDCNGEDYLFSSLFIKTDVHAI